MRLWLWVLMLLRATDGYVRRWAGTVLCRAGGTRFSTLKNNDEPHLSKEALAQLGGLGNAIRKCVQVQDKALGEEYRRQVMASDLTQRARTYLLSHLLSMCEKADDLPFAESIIKDIKALDVPVPDSCAMPLIRCYSDHGQFPKAWELIDQLAQQNTLRLRNFQPLIDLVYRQKNHRKLIEIFEYMHNANILPRDPQLAVLLRMHLEGVNLPKPKGLSATKIHKILESMKDRLLGFISQDLVSICAAANNQSHAEVLSDGLLISSRTDLSQEPVEEHGNGFITGWNATYPQALVPIDSSEVSKVADTRSDRYLPLGIRPSDTIFGHELFKLVDPAVLEARLLRRRAKPPRNRALAQGRMVFIPSNHSVCPHCEGKVANHRLSMNDRQAVIDSMKSAATPSGRADLQDFMQWLSTRPPFDYVVDGANVAYHSQNFEHGRFNYQQIDVVVRELEALGKRALVVLPSCYVPRPGGIIHNSVASISGKKKTSELSADDNAVLQHLYNTGSIYTVRNGGTDDDLYTILASVYIHPARMEEKAEPVCVVTNDLMRDHRLSIIAPRSFLRWTASQVVYYSFLFKPSFVAVPGESEAATMTDPAPSTDTQEKRTGRPESLTLFPPGTFSRDLQFDPVVRRWHLPATDRNSWLCLSLARRASSSNASSKEE